MKKLVLYSMVLLVAASCAPSGPQVSGKFDGLDADTLLVAKYIDGIASGDAPDTVVTADGSFAFDVDKDNFAFITIGKLSDSKTKTARIPVLPGQKLVLTGSFKEPVFEGSEFYTLLNEYNAIQAPFKEQTSALSQKYAALRAEEGADVDSINAAYESERAALNDSAFAAAADYISAHPSSDISAYITAGVNDISYFETAFSKLSPKVAAGKLAGYMESTKIRLTVNAIRKDAMKTVVEGAVAPEFTLETPDGGSFSLSSLKGKYVMLDFWGTWCYWCMKGLPTVKEIYAGYNDRLEIVSIDCEEAKDVWLKGIKDNEMVWTQVFNAEGVESVSARYGVQGYPSFYVINPEGVIEKIFLGEPDDFLGYFESLLGAAKK